MSPDRPIDPRKAPPLGREISLAGTHPLGLAAIRQFAAAIGDDNPLYWDETYARHTPFGGIVAPPTMLFEVIHDIQGALDEDGFQLPLAEFLAPLGLPERGGNDYQVFQPVRPDDVISLRRRIVEVTEKQGKTGPMYFVTSEISFTNQHGVLLGVDHETMVGRERSAPDHQPEAPSAPPTAAPRAPAPLAEGDNIPPLAVPVTPVLTAMYCAVTWDFTRLHYDAGFARQQGFRERVVDPQMYGALLARMVTRWTAPAGRLRRLILNYRAPAYVGDTLVCRGNAIRQYDEDGQRRCDCELLVENQLGTRLVRASAILALTP